MFFLCLSICLILLQQFFLLLFVFYLFTDAPIYLSFPHFYKADPTLLDAVDGLKPDPEKHETYFKIQPVSKTLDLVHNTFKCLYLIITIF